MKTVAQRKHQLLDRLSALQSRLTAVEAEMDSHEEKDWEELATEREGDEVLESIGLSGQAEIRQIEAALHRIETGDYGVCAKCGVQIAEQRLDLLPQTPFCSKCAN